MPSRKKDKEERYSPIPNVKAVQDDLDEAIMALRAVRDRLTSGRDGELEKEVDEALHMLHIALEGKVCGDA